MLRVEVGMGGKWLLGLGMRDWDLFLGGVIDLQKGVELVGQLMTADGAKLRR